MQINPAKQTNLEAMPEQKTVTKEKDATKSPNSVWDTDGSQDFSKGDNAYKRMTRVISVLANHVIVDGIKDLRSKTQEFIERLDSFMGKSIDSIKEEVLKLNREVMRTIYTIRYDNDLKDKISDEHLDKGFDDMATGKESPLD